MRAPLSNPVQTGLTITNPLVLYRSLLESRAIDPDPAQHRLAIHLQKLYYRLKDYAPETHYASRLEAIRAAHDEPPDSVEERQVAVSGHPLRRNPLFAHLFSRKPSKDDTRALTRVLTNHQAAIELVSPKGLLLHGEVGTGKSMLVDLLADSLPNPKKRRFHFNTFMLETFSRLEQLRKSRSGEDSGTEYSLLWLAKDLIDKSPILFLDEFQLPDRAASKILSNLFTSFFQLGGVLIASSNRMPDELSKASGMDFTVPPPGSIVRNWLGLGHSSKIGGQSMESDSARFVDVLKARCEIWDMDGSKDWRRRDVEATSNNTSALYAARDKQVEQQSFLGDTASLMHESAGNIASLASARLSTESAVVLDGLPKTSAHDAVLATPKKYFLKSSGNDSEWHAQIKASIPILSEDVIPWEATTLMVYGREIQVPRHFDGLTYWSFQQLCGGNFGPADYLTLASNFHTFVLDDVPVLSLLERNEARRLITLLDALYEARCKLIVRAEAGPDEIFFPEIPISVRETGGVKRNENDGGDAVYPETMSEIFQDQTSPFRPNVSSYNSDTSEDDLQDTAPGSGNEIGRQIDFGMTSSFTGEDERFAYKRARSRLWEMCGSRWHARQDSGWWQPLPLEIRRWEKPSDSSNTAIPPSWSSKGEDVQIGSYIELEIPAGLDGLKRGKVDE